jgi:hypothetical protein
MEKKQSKLYTEEQLRNAIAFGNISRPSISNDDWIKRQTPIQLPTDDDIDDEAINYIENGCAYSFTKGAKWVKYKINEDNNE